MKKVAYLFAGQGSQYVGMGKDLSEAFPESKTIFEQADKSLGFSLTDLMFNGPVEMLKLTINAQPAILTASMAAYAAFKATPNSQLQTPGYLAGLSLGEYSALIAAGTLNFSDGLKLVRKRAEIMEEATQEYPGKMSAVLDLPLEKIKEICAQSGAEIANLNAPGQVVITGRAEAVSQAGEMCQEAGAKRVIELEVSGAFHSSLMQEASEQLNKVLEQITLSNAKIPVVSNYTAGPQQEAGLIKENLVRQICSPVKWEDSMKFILSKGVLNFIEFGPGKVLKGLMRRIDAGAQVISIEKKEDILSLRM